MMSQPFSSFLQALSPPELDSSAVEGLQLSQDPVNRVVLVDGIPNWELSSITALPVGVYVGGLQDAPQATVEAHLVSTALFGNSCYASVGSICSTVRMEMM